MDVSNGNCCPSRMQDLPDCNSQLALGLEDAIIFDGRVCACMVNVYMEVATTNAFTTLYNSKDLSASENTCSMKANCT